MSLWTEASNILSAVRCCYQKENTCTWKHHRASYSTDQSLYLMNNLFLSFSYLKAIGLLIWTEELAKAVFCCCNQYTYCLYVFSKANYPLIIKTYHNWMLVRFPHWHEDSWRHFLVSLCSLWNMIAVWSALCIPARNYILSYIICYCFTLLSLLTLMKFLEDLVYYYLLWFPQTLVTMELHQS